MGVADAASLASVEGLAYSEAIGAQHAYIARRRPADPHEPVQLELLYRALCRAPGQVLPMLAAEVADV